ncbi:MAG: DUF4411 family protein [Selenomonadaceae bacterium]|nr:DUF4411 family protein [Selenomonadaceae bacterium]MBR4384054.1 DUF4411 family protein [Selenomonadaceae bacterium]
MLNTIKYCLDTNVISDFMHGNITVAKKLNAAYTNGNPIFIPTIVYYEIVRGLKAAGQTRRLKEFLALYKNFPHPFFDRDTYEVIEKAADIYSQLHKDRQIEDNDVFIAAMALVNDCTLVTGNVRHFERVDNLKLINWRID